MIGSLTAALRLSKGWIRKGLNLAMGIGCNYSVNNSDDNSNMSVNNSSNNNITDNNDDSTNTESIITSNTNSNDSNNNNDNVYNNTYHLSVTCIRAHSQPPVASRLRWSLLLLSCGWLARESATCLSLGV